MNQVIAFRALQGIGGAGLYSMPFTALPEITPPEKLGMMSGIFGMIFAVPILYFLILTTRYIIRFLRLRSIHKLDPTWFSPIAKKEEEHVWF